MIQHAACILDLIIGLIIAGWPEVFSQRAFLNKNPRVSCSETLPLMLDVKTPIKTQNILSRVRCRPLTKIIALFPFELRTETPHKVTSSLYSSETSVSKFRRYYNLNKTLFSSRPYRPTGMGYLVGSLAGGSGPLQVTPVTPGTSHITTHPFTFFHFKYQSLLWPKRLQTSTGLVVF